MIFPPYGSAGAGFLFRVRHREGLEGRKSCVENVYCRGSFTSDIIYLYISGELGASGNGAESARKAIRLSLPIAVQHKVEFVMQNRPVSRIVLVMVDDDEDDCLLVEAALYEALMKCDFHCVEDGLAMMDYLNSRGRYSEPGSAPRPDIILLDLNMPRMNGIAVLHELKTDPRFRSIPVIILTTSKEEDDVIACYDLGANTYITKQPSFEGLVSALRSFREYWLETATLPLKSDPTKRKKDKLLF